MDKITKYRKVISCSGITDSDLPGQDKCPFYSENNLDCALSGDDIDDDSLIPVDCLFTKIQYRGRN